MKRRNLLGILGVLGILGILWVGLLAYAQGEETPIGNKASPVRDSASNGASEVFWQFLKKLPDKALEIAKSAIKKMTDLIRGSSNVEMKQWFNNRKEAIKQGLKEEKQELQQDLKGNLSKLWQKIKDAVKNQ